MLLLLNYQPELLANNHMSQNDLAKYVPCESADSKDLLTKTEIENYLTEVEGWEVSSKGAAIEKQWIFKDFVKAMAFVDQVADVAEAAGHHPDITISYNKVTLVLTTHSIGGLTKNDFIVAAQINGLWLAQE